MDLDNILKRRALRLKSELAESDRPKPSFLSTIYPAMDHGKNSPHVVKTPSSIPSSNDKGSKEPDGEVEKKQKEKDEPGPSKTTSSSLMVCPGQSAMVPDAHKRAAFELGYFGENRSEQFVARCIELITGVKKIEQADAGVPSEVEPEVDAGDSDQQSDHFGLSSVASKFKKPKASYG